MNVYNIVGTYCYRTGLLCEHNLKDASINPQNVCSAIGGKCNKGSAWSYSLSKLKEIGYRKSTNGVGAG